MQQNWKRLILFLNESGRTKPANSVGNCPARSINVRGTRLLIQIREHLSKCRNDFF